MGQDTGAGLHGAFRAYGDECRRIGDLKRLRDFFYLCWVLVHFAFKCRLTWKGMLRV